jgi:hypothetical protein
MSSHKVNVTLKAGRDFDAPWVTIGSDSASETAFLLKEISGSTADAFNALVADAAAALKGHYTASETLGAVQVPAPPQAAPEQALAPWDQPQAQAPAFVPQQQQQFQQQPAQTAGPRVIQDKWGGEWTYDRADAPMTPRGPAVAKKWQAQSGSICNRWFDPAAGPEWFSQRKPKVEKAQQWEGGWIGDK